MLGEIPKCVCLAEKDLKHMYRVLTCSDTLLGSGQEVFWNSALFQGYWWFLCWDAVGHVEGLCLRPMPWPLVPRVFTRSKVCASSHGFENWKCEMNRNDVRTASRRQDHQWHEVRFNLLIFFACLVLKGCMVMLHMHAGGQAWSMAWPMSSMPMAMPMFPMAMGAQGAQRSETEGRLWISVFFVDNRQRADAWGGSVQLVCIWLSWHCQQDSKSMSCNILYEFYTIAEDADSVSGVRSRMHDFEEEEES